MKVRSGTLRGLVVGAVALAAYAAPFAVRAEDAEEDNGSFSLVFDNDMFYDTDEHYTNGLRLSYLTSPSNTPEAALRAGRWFPLFPEDGEIRMSVAIGQSIFTPRDTDRLNPDPDDRPYAGFAYGAVGLVAENGAQLDQLELTLGVVGPSSFAEETQEAVHSLNGYDSPEGWDYQLDDEPGVILSYQRSWRGVVSEQFDDFYGLGFDVTPHAGGALGNVYTYANAGVTFRLGVDLPLDYGPPRIQPSLPGSAFFKENDGLGWYLFAGAEGRAVARNIFLDGNTFQDSRSVDKEVFVGDVQVGVAATWRSVRLSYTHVFRTREFETQDDEDSYGTVSASVQF